MAELTIPGEDGVSRGQILIRSLMYSVKNLYFFPYHNGKLSKDFQQGSNMVKIVMVWFIVRAMSWSRENSWETCNGPGERWIWFGLPWEPWSGRQRFGTQLCLTNFMDACQLLLKGQHQFLTSEQHHWLKPLQSLVNMAPSEKRYQPFLREASLFCCFSALVFSTFHLP